MITWCTIVLFVILGDPSADRSPPSSQPVAPGIKAAAAKYQKAIDAAEKEYHKALVKAKKIYLKQLKSALKRAMQAEDLVAANAIDVQIKHIQKDLDELVAKKSTGRKSKKRARAKKPRTDKAWFPPLEVVVPAARNRRRPVITKVHVVKGQHIVISPNPADTWFGGGSRDGVSCNYMGYPNRQLWMRLFYQIGDRAPHPVERAQEVIADSSGTLKLFAYDEKSKDNMGKVRVTISTEMEHRR